MYVYCNIAAQRLDWDNTKRNKNEREFNTHYNTWLPVVQKQIIKMFTKIIIASMKLLKLYCECAVVSADNTLIIIFW